MSNVIDISNNHVNKSANDNYNILNFFYSIFNENNLRNAIGALGVINKQGRTNTDDDDHDDDDDDDDIVVTHLGGIRPIDKKGNYSK